MNYVSDWIDTLCMEWQKQLNDFMIIDGLEDANSSIIAKGALLMDKQKKWRTVQNVRICREIPCFDRFGMCSLRDQYHFIYAAFCLHLARHPRFNPGFCCRGYISCNGERPLCVDGGCVCNGKHFNLFYRPELYSSGGVSYSHQYEKICNSSYRDAAVGVFQPKCKRTAQKNH